MCPHSDRARSALGVLLAALTVSCFHRPEKTPALAPVKPSLAATPAPFATPSLVQGDIPGQPIRLLPLSPDLARPPAPHDPFASGTSLYAVWAFADYLAYAVGERGALVRWNGSRWDLEDSGTSANLHAIWGSDPQHIFAVGQRGVILTYTGKSWNAQQLAGGSTLNGLSGDNEGNIWAVGDGGQILKWNGTWWIREAGVTDQRLNAVWAAGSGEVWAVGEQFTRLHRLSTGWVGVPADGFDDRLRAVWGFVGGGLIAVGRDNTRIEWDGKAWQYNSCNPDYADCEHYQGVYGTEASRPWIIDNEGNIRGLGRGIAEKTRHSLFGIHGFRRQSIWAVGARGRIWYYDGTRWTRTDPGPLDSVSSEDGRESSP